MFWGNERERERGKELLTLFWFVRMCPHVVMAKGVNIKNLYMQADPGLFTKLEYFS